MIKPTPITQRPPISYFNAALHTYTLQHTLTDTHHTASSYTHIHLQSSACRCITRTHSRSSHKYAAPSNLPYAGVQSRQRYTQTEQGRATCRPNVCEGQVCVFGLFFSFLIRHLQELVIQRRWANSKVEVWWTLKEEIRSRGATQPKTDGVQGSDIFELCSLSPAY